MRRVKSAPARLGDLRVQPVPKSPKGPVFVCPPVTEPEDGSKSARPDVARMAMVEASSMVTSKLATSGWPTDLCDFVAVLVEEVLCGSDGCNVTRGALLLALGRAATNALGSIVMHKVVLALAAHISTH